ncbi:MAG: hypothetical protein J7L04_03375 [Bacteroidales bacterium]|nr:hypothetical protein [Bacteroidales bacterium]
MSIFTFRAISQDEEDFVFELQIRSNQTFYDLHKCFQKELNYDENQMASFYLTNSEWEKEKEINLFDMFDDNHNGNGLLKMKDTILKDKLTHEKSKILYVHDFFYERALFIELIKINDLEINTYSPECMRLEGKIPQQILMPESIPSDISDILNGDKDDEDELFFESLDDLDI